MDQKYEEHRHYNPSGTDARGSLDIAACKLPGGWLNRWFTDAWKPSTCTYRWIEQIHNILFMRLPHTL